MRLTYKYEKDNGYGSTKLKDLPQDPLGDRLSYVNNAWEEQRNKLGQLEDIEEELGIDLVTLFKALNYPIYVKEKNSTYWYSNRLYGGIDGCFLVIGNNTILYFEDYGKTWALTKEELEND